MLKEVYKVYKNNPPHLFKPHSKYMVTGGTYLKRGHLIDSDSKERMLLHVLKGCQRYGWKLEEWVILNNHYHLILESPGNADSLPQLINSIHRFTSIWIIYTIPEISQETKCLWFCIRTYIYHCANLIRTKGDYIISKNTITAGNESF